MAVLVVFGYLSQTQIDRYKEILLKTTKDPLSIFIRVVTETDQKFEMHLSGPDTYGEIVHLPEPMRFCFSPATPFIEKEEEFANRAELVKEKKMLVVDSCGAGIWPICLSPFVEEVVGLDRNPYALLDAKENAERHGVKNACFLKETMEEFLDSRGIHKYTETITDMVVI
ncbi:MAG: hypothetical protein ChlgKO_02460 [Chlamydiales bacterium]